MTRGKLVEARCKKDDLAREDAQLANITRLGLRAAGETNNAYPLQYHG